MKGLSLEGRSRRLKVGAEALREDASIMKLDGMLLATSKFVTLTSKCKRASKITHQEYPEVARDQ